MPVHTGTGMVAMARATASWSNAARSALDPPPRTTTATSHSIPRSLRRAAVEREVRGPPLHLRAHHGDEEAPARRLELTHEVPVALAPRARDETDPAGHRGDREAPVAVEESLGVQGADERSAPGRDAAEQGRDVDLPQHETHFGPGLVEVQRTPHHHHHAGLEADPLALEGGAERLPRRAPALDLEHRRLTAPVSVGIDQIQVAMTGPVGDVLDLTPDPQQPGPGERSSEDIVDLVVELGNGEGVVGTLVGLRLPGTHPITLPTAPLVIGPSEPPRPTGTGSGPGRLGRTVSRPGGRGPGRAGWHGTGSRKVGAPQGKVLANGQSG